MRLVSLRFALVAVAMLATTGCSTLSNKSETGKKSWSPTEWFKKEYQKPTSLAVIWAPDVLTMSNRPSTRGVGGRVYFYNEKSQAIPVDGDLIVHAYLTTNGKSVPDKTEADKSYGFTGEQLATHFSPSQLGASYSIWIPWDSAGGEQAELTLISTFKSADGVVVQGAPARVLLPGTSPSTDTLPSPMQTVAFRKSSIATNPGIELPKANPRRTTTITLPQGTTITKRRKYDSLELQQAAAQAAGTNASFTLGAATNTVNNGAEISVGGVQVGAGRRVGDAPAVPDSTAEINQAKSVEDAVKKEPVRTIDLRALIPPSTSQLDLTPRTNLDSKKPTHQMVPWTERRDALRRNEA